MGSIFLTIGIYFSLGVCVNAFNILGVCPALPHSHFTLCFRLMKELIDRGHEVTFINSHPQKKSIKNLRDISVKEVMISFPEYIKPSSLSDFSKFSYIRQMEVLNQFGKMSTEKVLHHKSIQDLMKSDEKFDLVILHHFFNEALAVFAHKFSTPLIILTPWSSSIFDNHISGNPAPSSYVAHMLADYDSNMNFWERLENTFARLVCELAIHLRIMPAQTEILKKAFPDAPELSTILYNASLLLTASHISLGDSMPLQQNIKEIGGYHVKPPKPLPRYIQDLMDSSTEGVVVFSMGSNWDSSNFEPAKRQAIMNAFCKIKQKVLWKFESDLPEKPDNVYTLPWLPQSDVLAHPKIVAFISHGGLLGTTEAVYYGVPILGLPVFWDQIKNIAFAVRKGFALKVDLHNLDEESFGSALQEILNNPKYRNIAKERSKILRDQPMKQLDEAVFWTEYVIRHKGAAHLRSAALNLRWYQLYLLDIIVFFVILIAIFIILLYCLLNYFCRKNNIVRRDKKNK